jgi:hypothetical protein
MEVMERSKNDVLIVDRRSNPSGGRGYVVNFKNDTGSRWTFVCFQQSPTGLPDKYSTLAWFAKTAAAGTKIVFEWDLDYNLLWSEQGTLAPGVVFNASQTISADPSAKNALNFTYADGVFTFAPGTPPVAFSQPPLGALYINQDGTIPFESASVGIGMGGFGTFAVPAQPNVSVEFAPTPEYYIMCVQDAQEGEVLHITESSLTTKILFPPTKYVANATLGGSNEWTITYAASEEPELAGVNR